MTLSREERLKNIDLAIRTLIGELGEGSIIGNAFRRPGPEYADILETTWDDMQELGWIQTETRFGGNVAFWMTGAGWIEGMKRTGQMDTIRAMLPRLSIAAKNRIKGRQEDGCAHVAELAQESGLSREFVENAIESRLLEVEFPGKKMELPWAGPGTYKQVIRIPRSFGMEYL